MHAHTVRFAAAFQALLLMATLLIPALAYAEEPAATSSPTPTEQPSDPPAEPTPEPTAPPPSDPDPTTEPEITPAPEPPLPATPEPTAYVPSGPPSIASDKADYAPGELVILTGASWLAGESVHIYVNDDHGSTWSRNVDVVANGSGEIVDAFNLPDWFVAEYVVIATGAQSGVAMTSFTDGNVRIRSNGSFVTFTLTFTEHTGTTCAGAQTDSGTETGVGFAGGAQHTEGVGNTESIKLTAAATSDQGGAFSHWVANNGSDPFTVISAQTICVSGQFGGTREYVAVYASTGSVEWEKRDDLNALLGGATFTVSPNPITGSSTAGADTLTVIDNGANDSDPDPGQLNVSGIANATTYTVTETVAPSGFAVDSDSTRTQAVSAGSPNPVIGVQNVNDPGTTNESDFHNRLGTLSWEKRTALSPFPLQGGATFTISPNPFACYGGSALGTIADDIDGTTAASDVDKDPLPGRFTLARVCLATYTITESSAPTGFAIDPDPTRVQSIPDASPTSNSLNAVVGANNNQAGTTDESDFHNPLNTAPTVTRVNASVTVDEGQTAANTGTYTDPNVGQDVTITASVGSVTKTGTNSGTWSWSFGTTDGPAESQTVTITADDGAGGTGTTTFQLTVNNVAPTATLGNNGPINEGSSATVSFSGQSDPSTADTTTGFHYAFSCTNGDLSGATYAGSGTSASTSCSFDDNGVFMVKGRIIDKDDAFTEYTTDVTVNNVVPTASLANGGPVAEGSAVSITFSGQSDPSSADTTAGFHYAYDCLNGSLAGATYAGSGTSASTNCTFDDGPATKTVKARIIDKDGGFTEYTTDVTVNNVAPTATFSATTPVNEGFSSTVSLTSPLDPSTADTTAGFHYAFACYGESLAGATYAGSGTASSMFCAYDDGPIQHTVRVRIIDKDGGFTEYSALVTVNNVSPSATFSNNGPINEGSSATVTFTSPSDPSTADTTAGFKYSFACDGLDASLAGTYAAAGAPTSAICAFDDGPSSPLVKGRIFDKDDGYTQYTTTVTVNNVAPTATFSNNGPVNEGTTINLSLTSPFDPSSADTTAGFEYRFSCDDGTTWTLWSSTSAGNCPTTDNGTVKVKGQIRDKDLGGSTYTADVTVNNVAPTATFNNNGPVNEGTTINLSLTSPFDPSSVDTAAGFEYRFSCDDGFTWSAWSSTNTGTCPTTDDGTVDVKGQIRDKDLGVSTYSATVTVNNVEPTLTISGATNVDEGSPYSLTLGAVVDPGTDVVTNIRVNWGDGSFTDGAGVGVRMHTYADGPAIRTITVDITDEDGTFLDQANAKSVTVDNVAPTTSNLLGDTSVLESGVTVHTYTYDLFDPGTDVVTAFPSCGTGGTLVGTPSNTNTSGTFDCKFLDGPASPSVEVYATDDDAPGNNNPGNTTTLPVSVANVAPTATFGATTPVDEGAQSLVSLTGPSDPSPTDTTAGFHYAFACDGEDLSTATYAGSVTSSSELCSYDDGPSTHTVKARIIDKDGGFTEYTASVDVDNVSPVAMLSNNGPINEGSSATITFSDPSDPSAADTAAGFKYSFACDGLDASLASTYAGAGAPDSTSCAFDDGPSSPVVKGRIFDKDDGYSQYSTTVSVLNVAPTAVLANSGPVNEGSPATVSFSGQSDPSTADTAAGFHYAYSCTNGDLSSATYAGTVGSTASTPCTYGDNGTYTVRARIIDKDGGSTEYTTLVVVNNVAPSRTGQTFVFNPFTGNATATVSFSDPGWLDVVSSLFNWAGTPVAGTPSSYGPGTDPGPLTGTFSSTRDFSPGCFNSPVTVRVSDDDGGYFDYTYATSLNVYTVTWQAPLKDGQRNVVKKGNVIPVKLSVVDCLGNPVTDKTLSIRVVAGVVDPADIDDGVYEVPESVSGADTTGYMRQVDSKYMYNLATKTLTVNMPYTIVIRDGSVLVATAVISTK